MYDRHEPIFAFGLLAMLLQGIVLGYFYPTWYKGGAPLVQGIKYGVLMVYSVSTFANAAKIQVTSIPTFPVFQTLFHAVQFVLVGAAIGWIYRRPAG